ncbi:peptide chain release factor N(5)-glutamine methyltransferase [Williamsia sp. CHRR-6]|uniref:peptide chain release factor N(5)-glutamine methyltransferase n=1 Tax=Williamsia sp. CHRR-6 TaxID=2835871 RepID=UPI001BD9FB43|nr:peptide chain release factor N(5)-glutamine methyltransferase [Williamsia sp. CHRR-6]MBT0568427.1 peptide chain release factor N(5)-glutamine methyltransferase [Williamsia sp. CHRR-6]
MTVRSVIAAAAAELARVGIDSPRVDAELLVAHVLGVDRGRLIAAPDPTPAQIDALGVVLSRRIAREPLQHIVGRAPFGPIELLVGPGVFIPRPETEVLLQWALAQLAGRRGAKVADFCSGSGALAVAVATGCPTAQVSAVEVDDEALTWLQRNVEAAPADVAARIEIRVADVRVAADLADLEVDLVVANPPYVPWTDDLDPEVLAHDPHRALFGGDDGMSVIIPMIEVIATVLVPGGWCGIEHDDTTGDAVTAALDASGAFDEISAHRDLAGRPRFVAARRRPVEAQRTGAE